MVNRYPRAISLLVAALCCLVLIGTLSDYGITWDELIYLNAGHAYVNWLLHPSLETLSPVWQINCEHPPLHKVLGGLTQYIFHEQFAWTDELSAFRLSTVLFAFLLLYGLHRFATQLYGTGIACIVTLSFFFMPRVFFHAHLGAMDYSITMLIFGSSYAYWKSRQSRAWIYLCGVLLGFGFLTKINIYFTSIPIMVLFILDNRSQAHRWLKERTWNTLKPMARNMASLWPLVLIPPFMFIALWPYMWITTWAHLKQFLDFHLHHFNIPVYYFGKTYDLAPWHYPFVLTLLTMPLVLLIAVGIGLFLFRRLPRPKTHIFLLVSAFLPLIVIAMPDVPTYDGVRLFLPAFPFFCLLGGAGLYGVTQKPATPWNRNLMLTVYVVFYAVTVLPVLHQIHPHETAYFNTIAGGTPGGSQHGLESEYWGSAYTGVLGWINKHDNKTYWVPIAGHLFQHYYKERGILNPSISFGNFRSSDYLVLLVRQGMMNETLWEYFRKATPVFSYTIDGVPLVNIYKIERK